MGSTLPTTALTSGQSVRGWLGIPGFFPRPPFRLTLPPSHEHAYMACVTKSLISEWPVEEIRSSTRRQVVHGSCGNEALIAGPVVGRLVPKVTQEVRRIAEDCNIGAGAESRSPWSAVATESPFQAKGCGCDGIPSQPYGRGLAELLVQWWPP